jgi:pyruvate/2-oxoglutarate dehydrogenase complex dihydrolipoamide dehydrogenase (E3) component
MTDRYDSIIIGAGQAGPSLAVELAQRGERVALIEADRLGGTCVNTGCTPTKTLRKSARVAHMARRAGEFGVTVGPVTVDFAAAMARMQQRVDASRSGLEKWIGSASGLTLLRAWGRLAGRDGDAFVVDAAPVTPPAQTPAEPTRLTAKRIFLNTGTRPAVPPIPGLDEVQCLDNATLLQLRECPRHLLVIGGSYIGLEMAQIFRRLGAEVTVIEAGERIASREDPDVSERIAQMLQAEGIRIVTGRQVERVARDDATGGPTVRLSTDAFTGSHLLLATGRTPNTDRLGLETVGLVPDARGFVTTNGGLETDVGGIWALGDINRRGAFTHTSYHDHEIVAANLKGGQRSADARHPIYAMFTDPPLAHVGLYEHDARRLVADGRRVSQTVVEMADVSRAKEESETAGVIKLLVDEDSGRFLGATLLGIGADEIVQLIAQLMAADGTFRTLRDALPVHPTVAEFLPTAIDRREPLAAAT